MKRAASLAAALLLAVLPGTAAAQLGGDQPVIRIGFGGGVSVPTSRTADVLDSGINGQAFVLVNTGIVPLRFNIGYQKFDWDETSLGGTSGETSVLSGVAGISLGLPSLGPVRPYVTAGLGAFSVGSSFAESGFEDTSDIRFGVDGGAGLQFGIGRLQAFVEGRVQNVYTDEGVIDTSTIRYVPVTFGILF